MGSQLDAMPKPMVIHRGKAALPASKTATAGVSGVILEPGPISS